MLYILFGANDFSLRERLEELKKDWDDDESLKINTTNFEASKVTLGELIDACNSLPFLGKSRLVIVEGLLNRFERRNAPAASPKTQIKDWQILVDYIPQLPPSTQLVFIDGKIGKNNPLLKKLVPCSRSQEFFLPKGAKLQQWIISRASRYGSSASPGAVKLLIELAGDNLWLLSNEVEKLSLYAGSRSIEEGDVRLLTSSARETNVFALVDAIVERRTPSAMRLLHQLLTEGMAPPYLLFMITRQIRLMVQVKELGIQRVSITKIPEELGLSPYYPVDRLLKQTAGYSMSRLIHIYHRLLETDLDIKIGRWEGEMALDLLATELCL